MTGLEGFTDALAAALLEAGGRPAVEAVCRACVAFTSVSGAGVTVMAGVDVQEPVCATDAVAERIDALQFALAEGPCLDAFRSGQPVLVADVAAERESRWPAFTRAISRSHARAVFAFPLRVGGHRFGVLNVYRESPGELGQVELAALLRAADSVVLALLDGGAEEAPRMSTEREPDAHENGRNVADWLDAGPYRAEVHQATGMITEQIGVDAATALTRLRAAAFASDRAIEDVAMDVIARRMRFEPDPPDPGSSRSGFSDDKPW